VAHDGTPYRGFWNGPLGLLLLTTAFAGALWLGQRTVLDLWTNGPPPGGPATKGAALGLLLPLVTGWAFFAGQRSAWRRFTGR
jgi:hypothetical protein